MVKWYLFDPAKGSRQKRPPIKRYVLVKCRANERGYPDPIVIGYRKDGAGDKQSPYFVTPGAGVGEAYAWCDCLPEDFDWPREVVPV